MGRVCLQTGWGEVRRLTAKHFVIATGSVIAPPLSLRSTKSATSPAITRSRSRNFPVPHRAGRRAIACELAQFFARFDVKVTLIQRSSHVLKEFDADAAAVVESVFRREEIKLFTGTRLLDAHRKRKAQGRRVEQEGKRRCAEAEEILLALGRSPNTAELGLANAGVATEQGRIVSDSRMRTSAPHIYAAGDCTGPYEIVHIAIQQAEIATHNLLHPRAPRRMDYGC